jgi:hypothetical protein
MGVSLLDMNTSVAASTKSSRNYVWLRRHIACHVKCHEEGKHLPLPVVRTLLFGVARMVGAEWAMVWVWMRMCGGWCGGWCDEKKEKEKKKDEGKRKGRIICEKSEASTDLVISIRARFCPTFHPPFTSTHTTVQLRYVERPSSSLFLVFSFLLLLFPHKHTDIKTNTNQTIELVWMVGDTVRVTPFM